MSLRAAPAGSNPVLSAVLLRYSYYRLTLILIQVYTVHAMKSKSFTIDKDNLPDQYKETDRTTFDFLTNQSIKHSEPSDQKDVDQNPDDYISKKTRQRKPVDASLKRSDKSR